MKMVNSNKSCEAPQTSADKTWTYSEYYIGEKDHEDSKDGYGRYHWSGAESLECYEGCFVRNTMHGIGEYRCRHRGPENLDVTYEGHFYNNNMHGYGIMSYADGRVFSGIYYNNLRWGPGIESYACLSENVGLWKGTQLVRLAWKPPTPSVVPDILSTSTGRDIAALNRTILVTNTKIIGEVNPARELLKHHGASPLEAAKKWIMLYPKNCTDQKSQLYDADVFNRTYYGITIDTLELFSNNSAKQEDKDISEKSYSSVVQEIMKFYAWNNNEMSTHMMKHCYKHDKQRSQFRINLEQVLNGPRLSFKPAAQHELDCRTVLMASYLGRVKSVARLINENNVQPEITDMQGNSAVMYAVYGSHPDIIHFLVEAGANVDDYNDACCTPLGAALVNYVCVYWDIPFSRILEAILPPNNTTATLPDIDQNIYEWKIERDILNPASLTKTSSNKTIKTVQGSLAKKAKSALSSGSLKISKVISTPKETKRDTKSQDVYDESFTEDKRLYLNTLSEYTAVVNDLYSNIGGITEVKYLFEANDIVTEIDAAYASEEQKKVIDKKDMKAVSKVIKDTIKPSKELFSISLEKKLSLDIKEKMKIEQMKKIMLTIKQLLLDGAQPRQVCCPQPALCLAISTHSSALVYELVKNGADVNEVYPQIFGYSPLDIAVSGPMTKENLDVIRILLDNGAEAYHRLPANNSLTSIEKNGNASGPTLLHAVLSKTVQNNDAEEDIIHQLIELLLEYGCDPMIQYKGRSAVDVAMSKQLDIFDIFIESPHTDLNAIINNSNQTILVKMFYSPYCRTISVAERIQTLTNLLICGADPLLKCQNGDLKYDNLFVYVNNVLSDIEKTKPTNTSPTKQDPKKAKSEIKGKKNNEKSKAVAQSTSKSGAKVISGDEIGDYKQTLNLITNCARLLFIRWIQAKLMKELIQVVDKFKHRHWNLILKEYKNGTCSGLWLNPIRCLEIWDILKTTKKRIYNDKRVLKYTLYMVLYYHKKNNNILRQSKLLSHEKATIESEVGCFIREHITTIITLPVLKRPYVTPEIISDSEISKFNICFECAMPLTDAKIPCGLCNLVEFCSFECMAINVERYNCHPCSDYLKKTYFSTPTSKNSQEMVLL